MVDIDRGPDWHDLLAQLIAGQYGRAAELDALTNAAHDRDAAITANYLVDPQLVDRAAELIALGWAVKKAKGRGEVEVLIANLEADAHAHHGHDTERCPWCRMGYPNWCTHEETP